MRQYSNLTNGLTHFAPLRPDSVAPRESVVDSKVKMPNACGDRLSRARCLPPHWGAIRCQAQAEHNVILSN